MPVDIKEYIEDGAIDADILQELEEALPASEPGDIQPTKTKDTVSSAGYVHIWDRVTGQHSVTNRNMLPTQLKKRREDGTRIFTVRDPHIPQRQGSIKCLLHKDDPNRKKYDEMGFPVCPMAHIPSPFQLELHMQKRHKHEWAGIQRERQMVRETSDRAFQQSIIDLAQKAGTNAPVEPLIVAGTTDAPLYVKEPEAPKRRRRRKV